MMNDEDGGREVAWETRGKACHGLDATRGKSNNYYIVTRHAGPSENEYQKLHRRIVELETGPDG